MNSLIPFMFFFFNLFHLLLHQYCINRCFVQWEKCVCIKQKVREGTQKICSYSLVIYIFA